MLRKVERLTARSAPRTALELVHDASHVERVLAEPPDTVKLDEEAWIGPGTRTAALFAVGGLLDGGVRRRGGRAAQRVRDRAAAGAPRRGGAADGLLPAQRDRGGGALGAARARRASGWRSSTGTSTTATGPRRSSATIDGADDLAAPGPPLSLRHRRRRHARRGERQRAAAGRHRRRRLRARLRARRRAGDPRVRARPAADRRRPGRGGERPARPHVGHHARLPRVDRPRGGARRRAAAAGAWSRSWRAATRCVTCPPRNLAILEGLAGLPSSFPEDPVGCDIPRGLRDVERAAVEAAAF